jgi:hypothetical protein
MLILLGGGAVLILSLLGKRGTTGVSGGAVFCLSSEVNANTPWGIE